MNFEQKKICIAPHTPKTVAFVQTFLLEHQCHFVTFIDKQKKGADIVSLTELDSDFDYILILSQNHFDSIYQEIIAIVDASKVVQVVIEQGQYVYYDQKQTQNYFKRQFRTRWHRHITAGLVRLLDWLHWPRSSTVFVSKNSVTSNNKFLYAEAVRQNWSVHLLTDNSNQLTELEQKRLPVTNLTSWSACWRLATAKHLVLDQGNFLYELNLLSNQQRVWQLWHGIPLKKMNRLLGFTYDTLISTSHFVNETSLSQVVDAKQYQNLGYPRNDVLFKAQPDELDLLFCDQAAYQFILHNQDRYRFVVYMPTHRENTEMGKIPFEFEKLNQQLEQINTIMIIKLHPFVSLLYADQAYANFSHIKFYDALADIYPVLACMDLLVTDYSSIYFDFMLLNKPIIFFDYDKASYEANMGGFAYPYEDFTPGVKVGNQDQLLEAIRNPQKPDYEAFKVKLFDYPNGQSSERILKWIEHDFFS